MDPLKSERELGLPVFKPCAQSAGVGALRSSLQGGQEPMCHLSTRHMSICRWDFALYNVFWELAEQRGVGNLERVLAVTKRLHVSP